MAYAYSNLDKSLKKWFNNDLTCATLHAIKLKGQMRSLNNISVSIDFPITAFAGKNGCGKTTVLALAACAYHNYEAGYSFKEKKKKYLTFSDFFIQSPDEVAPEGIEIFFQFLYNNWRGVSPGLAFQKMQKRQKGKWSKYEKRVCKNVIYLGIERVVPQTERQVYKSNRKNFRDGKDGGWYKKVQTHVGRILGKDYSSFKIKNAKSYKLHLVKETDITYSGFNMGAGEKALFEIFSMIYDCASNGAALVIIDEIELGLHEIAQRNLMKVLKEICEELKIQIICTTHSLAILDSIPPEGRFYIENIDGETVVSKGISGSFAAGRMSDKHSEELDIYVEDEVSATLLKSTFDLELRSRVGILPVGSFSAICRQMASAYRHPKLSGKSIAIFDGDQRAKLEELIKKISGDLELSIPAEKTKFREWITKKIQFLPGTVTPEKWIIEKAQEHIDTEFASILKTSLKKLKQELKAALLQESHSEFYYLSKNLSIGEETLINDFCRLVSRFTKPNFKPISDIIQEYLE